MIDHCPPVRTVAVVLGEKRKSPTRGIGTIEYRRRASCLLLLLFALPFFHLLRSDSFIRLVDLQFVDRFAHRQIPITPPTYRLSVQDPALVQYSGF